MRTRWVVVADSSRARIFELTGRDRGLRELDDLVNPAGRLDDRDIDADAKGRYFGKGEREQAHTAEPEVPPVQHKIELFSKQLGHYLDQACLEQRFDELHLIAPPKILGLIRQNIGDKVRQAIAEEIPKDLAWFQGPQIEEYLRRHPLKLQS